MGRCVKALVLKVPVTDLKPSTLPCAPSHENGALVEWYSAILHALAVDVQLFLKCPGTADLANMVTILFGGVGSPDVNAFPPEPEVRDVAQQTKQQTLAILSRTANLHLDQPITQFDISDARVDRIIGSGFRNLLQKCIPSASTLTSEVRRSCLRVSLKCLWYYAKAYKQLDVSSVASPEVIHLYQTTRDRDSRLLGRGITAMLVIKLMADVRSRTGSKVQIGNNELACMSTILGTENDDVKHCLEWPGAVELATIIPLALGDLGPFGVSILMPNVKDVACETIAMLSQALPAENAAGLEPFTGDEIFNRKLARVVVTNLHNLLQVHVSGASALTAEVRRGCLRMLLRSLWYCAKAYHPYIGPYKLPSYFPSALTSPVIIRRIQTEQDPTSRVLGHCFIALAVTKLAADITSRTDSTDPINDDELACLSTILGTQSHDVRFCLKRPGAIELACMAFIAFGDLGSFDVNAMPSGVRDVTRQTLAILSGGAKLPLDPSITQLDSLDGEFDRVIVSGFYNFLQESISGTSKTPPFTDEVRRSCLRMSLSCLWYCAKAYHQPGIFKPLPSYFTSTLARPEIIRLIHVEEDRISRVTGRCFGALIVMKLAVDIRSRADTNVQISDEKLACLSAILSAESPDLKIWLSQPCAIELANIVSLISSEIDSLFSETVPLEVLHMVQETYNILTRTLPAELNDKLTNFTDGQCEVKYLSRLFRLNLPIRDLTSYWYRTKTREADAYVSRELVALC